MKLMNDVVDAVSMEEIKEVVALESFVSANMLDTLKSYVPHLVTNIKDSMVSISSLFSGSRDTLSYIKGDTKHIVAAVSHVGFMNVSDIVVSTPEGFIGNYLQYAKTLVKVTDATKSSVNELFSEYNTILTAFATNKDDKISLQDHTQFFKKIESQRENHNKAISVFFSKNKSTSKAKLLSVVSRTTELEELYGVVANLVKLQESLSMTDIQNNVTKTIGVLDVITQQLQSGSVSKASGIAAKNICAGAYELAKYVEFIAVLYFDTTVFINIVQSMNKELENIVGRK